MDSLRYPYVVRSDIHETSQLVGSLQNLMELIREDIEYPLLIKAYVDQANLLLRTMSRNL